MTREIYQQCITTLGESLIDQNFYISFAKFETRHKELDRARHIYQYALRILKEGQKENLYNVYTLFEKQHGGKDGIEDVILSKRRVQYEDLLHENPHNYDVWFDYIRLEQTIGNPERIREVFERAVAHVPLIAEKRFWQRYIYLWILYAVWEESDQKVYLLFIKSLPPL
jgi:crooked neck